MDENVSVQLKGAVDAAGHLAGKGVVTFEFGDANKSSVGIDYKSEDKIVLTVESSTGFKISTENTLTVGGGLNFNLFNHEYGGKIFAEISINKQIAAQIEQEFAKSGNSTSLTLKLTF